MSKTKKTYFPITGFPGINYRPVPNSRKVDIVWHDPTYHSKRQADLESAMPFVRELFTRLAKRLRKGSELYPPEPTLEEWLIKYKTVLLKNRKIPKSKHIYNVLTSLKNTFRERKWSYLSDITGDALDSYFHDNMEDGIRSYEKIAKVKNFLTAMEDNYDVTVNRLARKWKNRKPAPKLIHKAWPQVERDNFWNFLIEDMKKVIDVSGGISWYSRIHLFKEVKYRPLRHRMILVLYYLFVSRYTGRPSESARLRVRDHDFANKSITYLVETGKTEVARFLSLDDETNWALRICCIGRPNDAYIFVTERGSFWDDSYISKRHAMLLKKAGLGHRMPYDYKYCRAQDIFENAMTILPDNINLKLDLVKSLTGHTENSKITALYIEKLRLKLFQDPIIASYNKIKVFPFDIKEYPLE